MSGSLIAVFLFSFFVGIGAVLTPGPVSTAIVSQAPKRGWQVGPLLAAGHALPELAIVLLLGLGLGAGLARPHIQIGIALGGGLLLIWMGLGMAWNTVKGKNALPVPGTAPESLSFREMFGLGIIATISNPFWYAWWVTVAPGYLVQAHMLGFAAILAFFLGHVSADFLWDTFLSAVVGSGRRLITQGIYNGLIVACGLYLIYLGGGFLIHGFQIL
jgi:threonine/homoserine/homoserine lactone efflux protein